MNVLVVDDDPLTRRMVKHVLSRSGVDVVEVASPRAALEQLAARQFDVLVTDWNMPEMSGIELSRRVRQGCSADIKIVMLTSHDLFEDRQTADEAGIDRYVTKPFSARTLADEVIAAADPQNWESLAR